MIEAENYVCGGRGIFFPIPGAMCVGDGEFPQRTTVTLFVVGNPHKKSRENGNFFPTLIQVLLLAVNIMKVVGAITIEKSEIHDEEDEEIEEVSSIVRYPRIF